MDVPLAQGLLGRGIRWWMSTMPGLAIVVAVMFNLLGDALSDALDIRDR